MSKYSLTDIKFLTKKENKKFIKLLKKFKTYDKLDILIELSKSKKIILKTIN